MTDLDPADAGRLLMQANANANLALMLLQGLCEEARLGRGIDQAMVEKIFSEAIDATHGAIESAPDAVSRTLAEYTLTQVMAMSRAIGLRIS